MSVRVVAVGASAGGVEALQRLVTDLPADLGVCVLVTVHITPTARSMLPEILTRAGRLPASHARDGQLLRPNTIVVAPPDRHLLAVGGRARLDAGPKVNRSRPSVDVMFSSAARDAGPAVAALVLSGALDDGAVGAAVVHEAGGAVFVQDPAEARFTGMPCAALAAVPTATTAPVAEIAQLLAPAVRSRPVAGVGHEEMPMTMADSGDPRYLSPEETNLTRLSCPDCQGSLAQIDLPTISYYRCHVGHQWSPQTLAAAQTEAVENRLWAVTAALDEQAALRRHLASHTHGDSARTDPAEHRRAAQRATHLAGTLRDILTSPPDDEEPTPNEGPPG
jgi:two-component system, chemotaxis family, protein-glutamate methylesterase/glutaminase